jgi:hypothetical protein
MKNDRPWFFIFDQFGPGCAVFQFPCENQKKRTEKPHNTLHIQGFLVLSLGSRFVLYVIRSCFACVFVCYTLTSLSQLEMTQQQLNIPSSFRHLISYPSPPCFSFDDSRRISFYFLANCLPFLFYLTAHGYTQQVTPGKGTQEEVNRQPSTSPPSTKPSCSSL